MWVNATEKDIQQAGGGLLRRLWANKKLGLGCFAGNMRGENETTSSEATTGTAGGIHSAASLSRCWARARATSDCAAMPFEILSVLVRVERLAVRAQMASTMTTNCQCGRSYFGNPESPDRDILTPDFDDYSGKKVSV